LAKIRELKNELEREAEEAAERDISGNKRESARAEGGEVVETYRKPAGKLRNENSGCSHELLSRGRTTDKPTLHTLTPFFDSRRRQ